jgi:cytochrome c biogenesis protein CcmG, thiol:disulfide interchange protein DsbE
MRLRSKAGVFLVLMTALISLAPASVQAAGLDLDAYKGKVVYLDFWASWCNPCRQSFPWMNDLQQTYGAQGLVVIGVNVDHDRQPADEFLQRYGAQFKILYDPEGKIASAYNFRDMPTSFLIGRDGAVHYVHRGFYPDKEGAYLSQILSLLDDKAP